jgi:hypothetical protein
VILLTASGRAPLDPYFTLLKPRGKLVSVSLTDAPCNLHPAPCALRPAPCTLRAYTVLTR